MVSVPSGRDAWSKVECWVSGGSFSVICGTSLLCPRASVELDESRTVVKDREIAVGLGWAFFILKWRPDVPALGSAACLMGMLAAIVRCDMRDLRWLRMIMRALLNRALFG